MAKAKNFHIYVFSHGETVYSKENRFAGVADTKLTKKGKSNARLIAKKLKNKKIDFAFSSPRSRSKNTLKEVLKYHPSVKLKTDKRLSDRYWANLERYKYKNAIEIYNEMAVKTWVNSYDMAPPKAESTKQVEDRVMDFIDFLLGFIAQKEANIAIATHDSVIKIFRKWYDDLTVKKMLMLKTPSDKVYHFVVEV